MKKKKEKNKKNSAGFIMVEMLVAVSLILLVLPGALSIATKSISMSSYQKDQLIATYLAEEGQDLIRSVRDKNVLTLIRDRTGTWNDGWAGKGCGTHACKIDYREPIEITKVLFGNLDDLTSPPHNTYRLYLNGNGFYSHTSSGTPTPFYRGVFITSLANDQVLIRSVVVWSTPFGRKEVTSSGFLSYWLRSGV